MGILDNSDPAVGGKTTFAGETVDATSVLVKSLLAGCHWRLVGAQRTPALARQCGLGFGLTRWP